MTKWMISLYQARPITLVYIHLLSITSVGESSYVIIVCIQRLPLYDKHAIFIMHMTAPVKRPQSSSVPAIIENNGEIEMVLGASGGAKIITATLQVSLLFTIVWGRKHRN